jgi:hypothetical protein
VGNNVLYSNDLLGLLVDWLPIAGTIKQVWKTIWSTYPGQKTEDYASCEGCNPFCSSCIDKLAFKYTRDIALPNPMRYGIELVLDIVIAKFSGVAGAVAGGVLFIDGTIGLSSMLEASAVVKQMASQAKGIYCKPE